MPKTLILDFDGVVSPFSELFKARAWEALFPSTTEKKAFEDAEKQFGRGRGGDRGDIIRAVLRAVGGSTEQKYVDAYSHTFDNLVRTSIKEQGIEEAERTAIEQLSRFMPLYISSATPQASLEATLRDLNIDAYFRGAFGRPEKKLEHFKKIAHAEGVAPHEIHFVGDSQSDRDAAHTFGCFFIPFVGRHSHFKTIDATPAGVTSLAALHERFKGLA